MVLLDVMVYEIEETVAKIDQHTEMIQLEIERVTLWTIAAQGEEMIAAGDVLCLANQCTNPHIITKCLQWVHFKTSLLLTVEEHMHLHRRDLAIQKSSITTTNLLQTRQQNQKNHLQDLLTLHP